MKQSTATFMSKMSASFHDCNKTVIVQVLRAKNLPTSNILGKLVNAYIKVYQNGPIKSYLGKTHSIKNTDPVWNFKLEVNGVRGTRFFFELYDDEVGIDQKLCVCTFDPNFYKTNIEVEIPLTIIKGVPKEKNQPTTLTVIVMIKPKSFEPLPAPDIEFKNPLYVTIEPFAGLRPRPPYDHYNGNEGRGIIPYKPKFDVSLIAFNENNYEYCCSSNRCINGAWHSGVNLSSGCASTGIPCMRIDPLVLSNAGYKNAILVVSTNDFSSLKSIIPKCIVTFWNSQEIPNKFTKARYHKLNTLQLQDLRPVGQYIIEPKESTNICTISIGYIKNMGSIFFKPINQFIPSDNIPITAQNIGDIIPHIFISLQFRGTFKESFQFPLYVPRSLNETLHYPTIKSISAIAPKYKTHKLMVSGYDLEFKRILFTCNESQPNYNGVFTYSGNTINVKMNLFPEDVFHISFFIIGTEPFSSELSLKETKADRTTPMQVIANDTKEIISCPYKFSNQCNSMIWFSISRDPFSGFTLVNFRKGLNLQTADQAALVSTKFINSALRVRDA